MEKEGQKEEEVVVIKKISKIELDELNRLHMMVDQAPDRLIGTLNLKQESKKNVLDYHIALSKKYKFNPLKIGINRHTGDLQILPKEPVKQQKKGKDDINKVLKKAMEEAYEEALKKKGKYK